MKHQIRTLVNLLSVGLVLFVNYYSLTAKINGNTVGELSDRYDNLFTPAGYAFSIWGIIFMALVAYVVYECVMVFAKKKNLPVFQKTGYWLSIANLGNATWVIVWLYEWTGFSVVVMITILIALVTIIVKTSQESVSEGPLINFFIKGPVSLYAGWITVATVANIAAYLAKLGWSGFLSEPQWAVLMIIVAGMVNLFMLWSREVRIFTLVGVWALMAIYNRHEGSFDQISWAASSVAVLLFVNVLTHYFYPLIRRLSSSASI